MFSVGAEGVAIQHLEAAVQSLQASVFSLSEAVSSDRDVVGAIKARLVKLELRLAALEGGNDMPQPPTFQPPLLEKFAALKDCDDKPEPPILEKLPERDQGADEEASLLEYSLGETLWDAPAIVGLPGLGGFCASAMLVLSMLLNAIVQIYITWVVVNSDSFISPDVWQKLAKSVGRWRINEAHESTSVDAAGVSLASRVCGQDDSLQVAGAQIGTLAEINSYLGLAPYELRPTSLGTGPLLSTVCILLFVVMVLRDLRLMCTSLYAVLALPRGRTFVEDGRLAAFSRPRLALFLAFQLLRVVVCGVLLYAGVMWLAYTSSITDLILNAAALGFVLDLDELLFETTVPSLVQKFVADLAPLKYRKPPCHMEAVMPALLLAVTVSASVGLLIAPQINDMAAVKEAMCAGNLDFAVQQNSAGYAVGRSTVGFDPKLGAVDTIKIKAVKEMKLLDIAQPGTRLQYAQRAVTEQNFLKEATMTIAAMAAEGVCQDLDTFRRGMAIREAPVRFMTVRHVTGIHRGFTHAEVPWRCTDYAGLCGALGLLRSICPITCGCTDPRSGLLFSKPKRGCPSSCQARRAQALLNESCVDLNVSGSPAWTQYWESYRMMMHLQLPQRASQYDRFIDRKIARGCRDTARDPVLGHDFCNENWALFQSVGIGGIRAFCPAQCCSGRNPSPQCPRACLR